MSRPGDQGQVQEPTGLGTSALPLAEWHLAEVAAVVRGQPVPLDPALLAVVLRGMAELCLGSCRRADPRLRRCRRCCSATTR